MAAISVLAAALLWGTTGLAAAFAPSLSPLVIGAVAMGGGGLLQAVINVQGIRRHAAALSSSAGLVTVGAACVAIYPLAFYTSMRLGGVALGTVVSLASAPLASALIERVVDGRALGMRWLVASSVGIGGGALLCLSHRGGSSGSAVLAGVALGLLAGVTYAGYSLALRRLLQRRIPRGAATGALFGLGGAALSVVAVAGSAAIANAPYTTWIVLAYLTVVPMFFGYVLFGRGLVGVDATTATTITLVEPAIATLLAIVVLHEQLAPLGWAGFALLALSLIVLIAPPPTPNPHQVQTTDRLAAPHSRDLDAGSPPTSLRPELVNAAGRGPGHSATSPRGRSNHG